MEVRVRLDSEMLGSFSLAQLRAGLEVLLRAGFEPVAGRPATLRAEVRAAVGGLENAGTPDPACVAQCDGTVTTVVLSTAFADLDCWANSRQVCGINQGSALGRVICPGSL